MSSWPGVGGVPLRSPHSSQGSGPAGLGCICHHCVHVVQVQKLAGPPFAQSGLAERPGMQRGPRSPHGLALGPASLPSTRTRTVSDATPTIPVPAPSAVLHKGPPSRASSSAAPATPTFQVLPASETHFSPGSQPSAMPPSLGLERKTVAVLGATG